VEGGGERDEEAPPFTERERDAVSDVLVPSRPPAQRATGVS